MGRARWVFFALVVSFAASLPACGNQENKAPSKKAEAAQPTLATAPPKKEKKEFVAPNTGENAPQAPQNPKKSAETVHADPEAAREIPENTSVDEDTLWMAVDLSGLKIDEDKSPLPEPTDEQARKDFGPRLSAAFGKHKKKRLHVSVSPEIPGNDKSLFEKILVEEGKKAGFAEVVLSDLKPRYNILPGKSIGPVGLNQTRESLLEKGVALAPHPSGQFGDAVKVANGTLHVVFDAEWKVMSVEASFEKVEVMHQGKSLLVFQSLEELGGAFEGCQPPKNGPASGGSVWECDGNLRVKAGGPSRVLSVQLLNPPS